MVSENSDRHYVERTRKISEQKALPQNVAAFLEDPFVDMDEGDFEAYLALQEKLKKRFTDESWAAEGTMTFTLDKGLGGSGTNFSAEYDSVIDNNLRQLLESKPAQQPPEVTMRDYRRIKNIVISNPNRTFDLRGEIGNNWSVYVHADNKLPLYYSGFSNPKYRVILDSQDITTPYGLYVLFHEVGHGKRNQSESPSEMEQGLAAREKVRNREILTVGEKKAVVKDERDADAFALGTLRHFSGPQLVEEFKKLAYTNQRAYHRKLPEEEALESPADK